jgi:3-ketosteroid 9alpha-monooxygenase subunit A
MTNADNEVRSIEATANPTRFARGWHCLGLSDGFRDGKPHQINVFDTELAVFADSAGRLSVLDAYCRHMGGNLAMGTIKGDSIACPFHDWRWGGNGKCTDIPYARRVPPLARTRSWLTLERNGQLFVWHDPQGNPPPAHVTIPEIEGYGSDEWTEWQWNSVLVEGSHCRELVDNVVDMAHFFYVHFNTPRSFKNVFEAHIATQSMSFTPRKDKRTLDFGDDSVTRSDASYFGPSYMIDEFHADIGAGEPLEAVLINCHYPVTSSSFVLQYGIMVKKMTGMTDEQATELAKGFGDGTIATFEQDIVIWRNKTKIDNPLLCEEDGPVYQLRRWYEQFYVDIDDVTDDMIRRFEFEIDTARAERIWEQEMDDNMAARRRDDTSRVS